MHSTHFFDQRERITQRVAIPLCKAPYGWRFHKGLALERLFNDAIFTVLRVMFLPYLPRAFARCAMVRLNPTYAGFLELLDHKFVSWDHPEAYFSSSFIVGMRERRLPRISQYCG